MKRFCANELIHAWEHIQRIKKPNLSVASRLEYRDVAERNNGESVPRGVRALMFAGMGSKYNGSPNEILLRTETCRNKDGLEERFSDEARQKT